MGMTTAAGGIHVLRDRHAIVPGEAFTIDRAAPDVQVARVDYYPACRSIAPDGHRRSVPLAYVPARWLRRTRSEQDD
jgi:hypothetical protein